MACRLYLQNASAPYTPATIRGAWDKTAGAITAKLGQNKSGASTTIGDNETNANNNFDVLLARFISDPLPAGITIAGTVQWMMGVLENHAAANDYFHVHIYITTGDSDTPRGTLLTDSIGATEWPTTPAIAQGEGAKTLTSVSASAGDRIVAEIGYQAQNTVTTSRIGTINYGGTGADLTAGDSTVTTQVGWFEFSHDIFGTDRQHKVKPKTASLQRIPLTKKLVLDIPFLEPVGAEVPIRNMVGIAGAETTGVVGTDVNWVKSPWGWAYDFATADAALNFYESAGELVIEKRTTFECIFKMDTMPTSTKAWFSYLFTDEDNTLAPQALTAVWRVGSGGVQASSCYLGINFYDTTNNDTVSTNQSLLVNEWYHVFFVTDGTNVKFYINGKLDSTVAFAITPTTLADTTWHAGRWADPTTQGGRSLDGQIALIRLWNRDLKPQEIGRLYADPWVIYKKPKVWSLGKAGAAAVVSAVRDLYMTTNTKFWGF